MQIIYILIISIKIIKMHKILSNSYIENCDNKMLRSNFKFKSKCVGKIYLTLLVNNNEKV